MTTSRVPTRRSTLAGVLSSGVSGLVNVLVQLVVAALVPAGQFGRFSVASATVLLVVGGSRLAVGQTDMLRGRPGRDDGPVNAAYATAGAVLAAGALLVAATWRAPGGVPFLIGLGLAASGVFVVQDCARHRAFRQSRPGVALAGDVIALLGVAGGLALLRGSPDAATWALLVWTLATAAGTLPAVVLLRYVPVPRRTRWLAQQRDLTVPGTADYLLQAGLPYLVTWVIALVGSYEALAGYRLVQLLFAAVGNVAVGLQATLLPRLVDAPDRGTARRTVDRQAAVLVGLSLAVCAGVVLLPDAWGTRVFGQTWLLALPFLVPAAVHGLANALSVMNAAVLRLAGRAVYLLTVRAWSVAASAVGVAVGVVVAGPVGAAWALAVVAAGAYGVRLVAERRALAAL